MEYQLSDVKHYQNSIRIHFFSSVSHTLRIKVRILSRVYPFKAGKIKEQQRSKIISSLIA